jgi:hypothetical protein
MQRPRMESIRQVRLQEASVSAQVDALLAHASGNLPGFIIRESGILDIGVQGQAAIAEYVREQLAHQHREDRMVDPQPHPFGSAEENIGPLHYDTPGNNPFNVHMTRSRHGNDGGGSVLLANSGPYTRWIVRQEEDNPRDFMPPDDYLIAKDDLPGQVLTGVVDERLMSHVLHVGRLSHGDTVVMPFVNTHGPVWHRYDTGPRGRVASAVRVSQVPK